MKFWARLSDVEINECKELMKKFLETIPIDVSEYINARRKEKIKWTGERLVWDDVLEIVEDRAFEISGRNESERMDANNKRMDNTTSLSQTQYPSYRHALKANPLEVMVKFLEDFYSGT